jgi:dethiobiotin synthetase
MPALFITATGTDVGKTFVACALIRALKAAGRAVDAFKPILSGFNGLEGSDAGRLLEALGAGSDILDRMSPLRFTAPLAPPSAARAEGRVIDPAAVTALCRARIEEARDTLLLIEGAGGVMSPLADGITNLDLIADLRVPSLLVTGSYLGAVSHTLTALAVLEGRGLPVSALVVSESGGDAPPTREMTEALRLFAPSMPVIVAHRDPQWSADGLAALLDARALA